MSPGRISHPQRRVPLTQQVPGAFLRGAGTGLQAVQTRAYVCHARRTLQKLAGGVSPDMLNLAPVWHEAAESDQERGTWLKLVRCRPQGCLLHRT